LDAGRPQDRVAQIQYGVLNHSRLIGFSTASSTLPTNTSDATTAAEDIARSLGWLMSADSSLRSSVQSVDVDNFRNKWQPWDA